MTTSKIERIKAEMIEYRKVVEEQRKAGRLPNSLIRGKVIAINHIDSLINQLEELEE